MCSVTSRTNDRSRPSRSGSRSPPARMRSGETFRSSHAPPGRRSDASRAVLRVASSRSVPEPTASASANRTSGRMPSSKRVSASYPRIASVRRSTMGWKTGRKAASAMIAWIRSRIRRSSRRSPTSCPIRTPARSANSTSAGTASVSAASSSEPAPSIESSADHAPVVADGRMGGEVRTGAACPTIVRVPAFRHGLDPGPLFRPGPEDPTALRRDGTELGIGPPRDHPAQRRRAAVELEDEQAGRDDPGQAGDLAADRSARSPRARRRRGSPAASRRSGHVRGRSRTDRTSRARSWVTSRFTAT